MKKKKLLTLAIVGIMLMSACGKKEEAVLDPSIKQEQEQTQEPVVQETEEVVEEETTTPKKFGSVSTVAELKQKYGVNDSDYIKPFYNVEQSTQFTFHFNSKVEPIKAVTVHTDPSCNIDSTVYQINSAYLAGSGYDIVVKPGSPVLNSSDRTDGELGNYNWGNAPVYYLSINYDMDAPTPTKLDKPIIVPFTVKRNISTPNVEASISTDGSFEIKWKPVENAVKYNIYDATHVRGSSQAVNMTRSQAGYVGDHLSLLASVGSDTLSFSDFNNDGTGNTLITSDGYVNTQNFFQLGSYYVTAIDASGNESSFSMAIEGWQYESQLPNNFDAWSYISKTEDGKANYLPNTVPVQMVDKSIHYYPINYVKVNEFTEGYATYEYEIVGTKLTGKIDVRKADKIYAPSITSTSVLNNDFYRVKNDINIVPDVSVNTITDSSYSNTNMNLAQTVQRDEATAVKYSQDALMNRADVENARIINDGVYTTQDGPFAMLEYGSLEESNGSTAANTTEESQNSEPAVPEQNVSEEATSNANVPSEITSENLVEEQMNSTERQMEEANNESLPQVTVEYFADSAEEEYLALNMIAANEYISLEAFPNLQNTEYLSDALMKVVYQNPYIFGFETAGYDPNSMTLQVKYEFDADSIHAKQVSVATEANNIVNSVIKDGMTDEEKVMALWTYMEEHTEYDTAALEYAEANGFQDISGFEDSFTSYGIMCKKVGVCQSYAYCYKILLSLCDVPCITLTGYMDQTLPHAWNAVYLNGAWRWMDVTNNSTNSGVPYMMYQTSSTYADKANYVVDDFFELNTNLNMIDNTDNSMDWYVENNCYATSQSDIIKMVTDNYDKFSDYACVKSEYEPVFDDAFMIELAKSLYSKGVAEDEIYNLRMGYMNGIFIIAKK